MSLKELINDLGPEIRAIAFKLKKDYPSFEVDDLIQEMHLYLWKRFKKKESRDCTRSYMLQGCWFHLKNYIRVSRSRFNFTSLDLELKEGGSALLQVLEGEGEEESKLEFNLALRNVMNNGLSKREKEVFSLILEGYTLREIGEKLKLSHVMVFKIKKEIKRKSFKHFF